MHDIVVHGIGKGHELEMLGRKRGEFGVKGALMLLSNIPVRSRRSVLGCGPELIGGVRVCGNHCKFNNRMFRYVVSLAAREKSLPSVRLDSSSQLAICRYPRLPIAFGVPRCGSTASGGSHEPSFHRALC